MFARCSLAVCVLTTFLIGSETSAQVIRPIPVPGRVEAENYDTNGPGISYYDTTPGNSGGVYRNDDVDIESTTDIGGGYDVGWISAGEWLNYTLNVAETAVYQLDFRIAALNSSGAIQVTLDGLPLCGVQTPSTGGWQNWRTVSASNIVLQAGQRLLHIDFTTGGYNLNYIQISRQSSLTGGFLRASGKQIIDATGQNVRLHGFGLGNWMIQEPYMMDVNGIANTQQELKNKIAALVGTNNMNAFYSSWLTNYITQSDVGGLAVAGFNSLRLPLHFALFTLPIDQEPVPGQNTWIETGFSLVTTLLGWCASNHMYLFLDMHACPGGQGYDQPISDYNPPAPSLWQSSTNQAKMIALWHEIARRYSTNQWIGGYDLINEPNWTFENNSDIHGGSDQTNAPLRQLMIDVTASIRQVDTNHLIIIEGNGWGNNYNGVLPPWDSNLALSFHKYWDDATSASFQNRLNMRDQWDIPLWLGETGENSNEWFRDVAHWCDVDNIGWSWWPWKKIGAISGPVMVLEPSGYQAILNYWRNGGTAPDTNTAFASLLEFAQAARYENCQLHPDVLDALMRPYPQGQTLPFRSNTVPGILFAADYDLGRQGEAYLDMSTTNSYNSGNAYRNDSVDIQTTTDTLPSNGYNVGWMDQGDWMKYSVTPLVPGPYAVYARVAGGASGGSFYLDIGGSNVSGVISVPNSGGWQNWTTIPAGVISNSQPLTEFKVVVTSPGFNLDWLTLEGLPGAGNGLPAGWTDQDIGTPGLPGSGAFNAGSGVWAVTGSGSDVWSTADQFNFVSRDLAGDAVVLVQLSSLTFTAGHPKAGIMFRSTLGANAAYAFTFLGSNTVALESRPSFGGSSVSIASANSSAPRWLKLKRTGNTFSSYSSPDGIGWNLLGATTFSMPASVKAGLAVCANNNGALNSAVFDNLTIITPPAVPTGVVAVAGNAAVYLQWPLVSTATSYQVKRSSSSTGPFNVLTNTAAVNFTDVSATNDITWFYVVDAANETGTSADSGFVSATPHAAPQLSATLQPGSNQLLIGWPVSASSYQLYSSTNLTPPGLWSPVTNTPVSNSVSWTVSIPVSAGNRFFRLQGP
jgi:hypothetical protein